jgi:hypothetical protein
MVWISNTIVYFLIVPRWIPSLSNRHTNGRISNSPSISVPQCLIRVIRSLYVGGSMLYNRTSLLILTSSLMVEMIHHAMQSAKSASSPGPSTQPAVVETRSRSVRPKVKTELDVPDLHHNRGHAQNLIRTMLLLVASTLRSPRHICKIPRPDRRQISPMLGVIIKTVPWTAGEGNVRLELERPDRV